MNRLLNPLRILYHRFFSKTKYPFIHNESHVKFNINNAIEEFRLAAWGGEKEYVQEIVSSLLEEDVFYDIGSSVGLVSINAAIKTKKGKVISFEPDPENQVCLINNYKLNNLENYTLLPIAVGEKAETLKLFTNGSNGFSPSLKRVNGIDRYIEVEVNSIDNLLLNNLIPYPTVIKIDIEGAEFIALKGMKKLLSDVNKPRILFIEIHPDFLSSFNTDTSEILDFMYKSNYKISEKIEREKQILCRFEKV